MQQHNASRAMLQDNIATPVNTHSASRLAAADQYGFHMQQGQHTPGFSQFQLQPQVQLQQQQQQQLSPYAAPGSHYRAHSDSSILAAQQQQQQFMQQQQGFPMQGGQPQHIPAAMQPLQAPHAGYAYSAWPASASAGGACISAASSAGGAYPGQLQQQQQQQPAGTPLQQQGWHQLSPASACSNLSPQHLAAALPAVRAAHSTAGSISMQSTGSCSGLGLQHVLKKYRRAKALLQAHLHETQRLKAVAAGEAQKAAAVAEQARALEAQLTASTAAVADATVAQQRLQQQVRRSALVRCSARHTVMLQHVVSSAHKPSTSSAIIPDAICCLGHCIHAQIHLFPHLLCVRLTLQPALLLCCGVLLFCCILQLDELRVGSEESHNSRSKFQQDQLSKLVSDDSTPALYYRTMLGTCILFALTLLLQADFNYGNRMMCAFSVT
jgi:hypothetical protein